MSLIRWTPIFEPFEDFFNELPVAKQPSFMPTLDIYQEDNNVVVEAPLVGINPEDVHVVVENNVLTIEGQNSKQNEIDEKNYYRKEVRYGSFHRSVALPVSVNGDKAKAEYDSGILKVVIPKQEKIKSKPVKIEIKKNKK